MVWCELRSDNKYHIVVQALKQNAYSYYPYMKSLAKFDTHEEALKWAREYMKNKGARQ